MGSKSDFENEVQSCHTNSNIAELNMLLEEVIALETEIKEIRRLRTCEKQSISRLRRVMVMVLAVQALYLFAVGFDLLSTP
ncbi:hypothetical protein BWQ96_05525 [Gracilariopsis chorda]|uniref:Transmembrane protein n=1 Tax=Gracilariopsis chorda TaxID=448386 RepID=A0A2V3IRC5_9FLOR|nr:hypothetical protein BWQ96_05525 [Gracilariopsis chorda]|eukprot:PXF44668.1 hypothetical protein BWQ96_05525 [Gracilariopsis chorda]